MYNHSLLQSGSSRRGAVVLRARQQRQRQQQGDPDIPPPPPTVAPPQGPPRRPLERSAYRQTRKTEEQREQQRAQAAAAARSAGRTLILDNQALQERYAAASRGATPAVAGQRASAAYPSRASSTASGATVTVIDGYNFLHHHPTTKRLMAAEKVDQARALLHQLLVPYAAEKKLEVLVVYDATTVRSTSAMDRVNKVSSNVQTLFRAGHEADNVIITAVQHLQQQSAAAAAAGLPGHAVAGPRVVVVTNDKRIQDECSAADLYSGSGGSVTCVGNRQLSDGLKRLENRLARFNQGVRVDNPAAAAAAVAAASAAHALSRSTVSIDQNSYAWAMKKLKQTSAGSRKQLRHRQRQQQQQAKQAQGREQLLTDEQLLLRAKAAAEAAGAGGAPSGVIASSTSQELDELLLLDDLDELV